MADTPEQLQQDDIIYIQADLGTPTDQSHFIFTDTDLGAFKKAPIPDAKVALGIDQVDNTADLDKPISTAQQDKFTALDID